MKARLLLLLAGLLSATPGVLLAPAPLYAQADAPAKRVFRIGSLNVVRVYTDQSTGSGVLIDAQGLILTNQHVVGMAEEFFVDLQVPGLNNNIVKRKLPATLVGIHPKYDLALVKLNAPVPGLRPAQFAQNKPAAQNPCFIIGSPALQDTVLDLTITAGKVTNPAYAVPSHGYDMILSDAAANPGNSGGAMFNSEGRLIGIVTLKGLREARESYAISVSVYKPKEFTPLEILRKVRQAVNQARGIPTGPYVPRPEAVPPLNGSMYAMMAKNTLRTGGSPDLARRLLERAIADDEMGRTDPASLRTYADLCSQLGLYSQAAYIYHYLYALNPAISEPTLNPNIASAYARLNENQRAILKNTKSFHISRMRTFIALADNPLSSPPSGNVFPGATITASVSELSTEPRPPALTQDQATRKFEEASTLLASMAPVSANQEEAWTLPLPSLPGKTHLALFGAALIVELPQENRLAFIDATRGRILKTLPFPTNSKAAVSGQWLLVFAPDGLLQCWDLTTLRLTSSRQLDTKPAYLAGALDGSLLWLAQESSLRAFSLPDLSPFHHLTPGAISQLSADTTGNFLLYADSTGKIGNLFNSGKGYAPIDVSSANDVGQSLCTLSSNGLYLTSEGRPSRLAGALLESSRSHGFPIFGSTRILTPPRGSEPQNRPTLATSTAASLTVIDALTAAQTGSISIPPILGPAAPDAPRTSDAVFGLARAKRFWVVDRSTLRLYSAPIPADALTGAGTAPAPAPGDSAPAQNAPGWSHKLTLPAGTQVKIMSSPKGVVFNDATSTLSMPDMTFADRGKDVLLHIQEPGKSPRYQKIKIGME